MKISFIMPGEGLVPSGGYRIVYEYSNALVRRGHSVTVVHVAAIAERFRSVYLAKRAVRFVQRTLDRTYRPDRWFALDPRVKTLWVPTLHECFIPDADAVLATWWLTAERVARYSPAKGKKFYMVQALETWGGPEDRVMATWKLPLQKIVICRWLLDIAHSLGEEATYIPVGLDFERFQMDVPPEKRDPALAMMVHQNARKGFADGLAAVERARAQEPSIELDVFGIHPPAEPLPDWVRYHQNPPQPKLRELYNRSAIFVAPSWSEGWGLTVSEAMQCGCAVTATDIGGHREVCIHEKTALLSPPGDSDTMAKNILRLVREPDLRFRLAHAGHEYVQQFTWPRAADKLEATLIHGVREHEMSCSV